LRGLESGPKDLARADAYIARVEDEGLAYAQWAEEWDDGVIGTLRQKDAEGK
jgi:hypothetical protein